MATNIDNITTLGDKLDKMSLDDLLNHDEFQSVSLFRNLGYGPSYFEFRFKSSRQDNSGNWLTFYDKAVPHQLYSFYKTKLDKP